MSKTRIPLLAGAILLLFVLAFLTLPGLSVKAQTQTKTFTPSVDAYVIASNPTTNYGTASNLRVDNSPITNSYLRFVVSGLNGAPVTSAKLRIYANSANSTGFTVHALTNNTWTETGITYNNAPAPGSTLVTSTAITASTWVVVDISSYVKAEGTYNLALTINSPTNTSLASREAGADAPQLVVTYGSSTITPTKAGPTSTVTKAPTITRTPTITKTLATTKTPTPTRTAATPTRTVTPSKTATPTKAAATATQSSGLTSVNLTKGPDLIYSGTNTQMKIFWQWTANTTFRLDWGTSAAYGSSSPAISAYDTTNHLYAYTVTGLTPAARYYYRVVVGSQYSAGTFMAAPASSASAVNFVSYGDNRSNPTTHDAVAAKVDSLFQSDPSYQTINVSLGDLVSSGDTDSTWTSEMFDPKFTHIRTELANISDLSVIGNHEGSGGLFARYFPMPFVAGRYWSFDYGPMHVVMMDQYSSYSSGSAQYNWVKSDLAATTKKWIVVAFHEPGYSANGGHPDNTTMQTVYEPLFEQYHVALALSGHNHYYSRAMVNGIPELTIGTGGAPLYTPQTGQLDIVKTYEGNGYAKFSISGSTLTGWFISSSGSTIDTFTVTR